MIGLFNDAYVIIFFLIFFIESHVVDTHLNCLNKSIKTYFAGTHLNCLLDFSMSAYITSRYYKPCLSGSPRDRPSKERQLGKKIV